MEDLLNPFFGGSGAPFAGRAAKEDFSLTVNERFRNGNSGRGNHRERRTAPIGQSFPWITVPHICSRARMSAWVPHLPCPWAFTAR